MSLEIDAERSPLAGPDAAEDSAPLGTINEAAAVESGTGTPNGAPGATGGRESSPKRRRKATTAAPHRLTVVCDTCETPIRGSGAGFLAVDLAEAQKVARRAAEGRIDPAKAPWHVAHARCLPEALRPLGGWQVIWCDRLATVDDLLDVMADLSRHPWHGHTDWGRMVRRILGDTHSPPRTATRGATSDPAVCGTRRKYVQDGCRCDECRAANAEHNRDLRAEAKTTGLPPGDPRHGTVSGYNHWSCRCPECCYAKSESRQAVSP